MLRKSSSQKTLRDVMQEERTGSSMGMASRLLAPDASLSNPSFLNYYGVAAAGSVPFLWESAPGTPKNGILSTELPPLTPPPSYYSKTSKSKSSKKLLPSPKPAASFVSKIFRRSYTMPSPSSTKESIQAQCSRRRRLVDDSPRSSFSSTSRVDDEEGDDEVRSTLCFFGTRHSGGGTGRLHGPLASVVRG